MLTSFIHSYKPPIKGQMIMLPLHSQATAAVENNFTGQDEPYINCHKAMFLINSRVKFCRVHAYFIYGCYICVLFM